jgi:hypothetical protein
MAVLNFDKLQVMTWNADSVSPKKHELFDFLLSGGGGIDIALLNETYLKQGVPFSHPNCRCYRFDRVTVLRMALLSWFPKIYLTLCFLLLE